MKIWLIGHKGILGSSIASAAIAKNLNFIGTSSTEVDITREFEVERFLKNNYFTHIINCAAYTSVDEAEKNLRLANELNAKAVENLSIACHKKKMKLIHFSSDYVFSGDKATPYKEDDPTAPINAYGKSKEQGEKLLFQHLKNGCVIRTSWLFGKGKNFISTMIRLMQEKEEIKVVSDQIGRPTCADDLAKVTLLLLDQKGIFHFANDEALSWYEYALKIYNLSEIFGIHLKCKKIVPVSSKDFITPARRPLNSVLDTNKVENLLKKSTPCLDDALMRYFKKNYA